MAKKKVVKKVKAVAKKKEATKAKAKKKVVKKVKAVTIDPAASTVAGVLAPVATPAEGTNDAFTYATL